MNYQTYPQQQYLQQQNVNGYNSYRPIQYPWMSAAPGSAQQVRPVSSIEEVRAYPIDFDGSVFYFSDVANKRIYTKTINLDGTAAINLYELKEINNQTTDQQIGSYVTKEEMENEIRALRQTFEEMLINTQKVNQEVKEDAQFAAAQSPKTNFVF